MESLSSGELDRYSCHVSHEQARPRRVPKATPCDACGRPWVLIGPTSVGGRWCWPCHRAKFRGGRSKKGSWRLYAHAGLEMPLPAWAERLGVTYATLLGRIKRLGVERALGEPIGLRAPRVIPPCAWCDAASVTSVADESDGCREPACAACAALGSP